MSARAHDQPCAAVASANRGVNELYGMVGGAVADMARVLRVAKWIVGLLLTNLGAIGGLVAWNQRAIAQQARVAAAACVQTAESTVLRQDRLFDEKLRAFAVEVLQQDRERRAREGRDPDVITIAKGPPR